MPIICYNKQESKKEPAARGFAQEVSGLFEETICMFEPLALFRYQIDVFAIILLCYVLFRSRKDYGHQTKNIAFCRLNIAIITELVLDIACWLVDEIPGVPALRYINIAANLLYIVNCGLIAYLWYCYVCVKIDTPDKHRVFRPLVRIPLVLFVIATVSSVWTKAVFYIDASNTYHDGPLIFSQLVVGFGYLLFATIKVLMRLKMERRKYMWGELFTLLMYFVLNLVGGILELLFPLYPFTWTVTALSLTMVHGNLQSYQISIDELTGLNNRRRFDYYLNSSISSLSDNDKVYLLLGDVNSFKTINDKFGHVEGDHALICVADILKNAAGRHKAFAARYGGDEFALIVRGGTYSDIEKIRQDIQMEFAKQNAISDKPYELTLSFGIGEYCAQSPKSTVQLIKEADEKLYIEKNRANVKR